MEQNEVKVGIVSCSGEDLCEGTISRLATRRVLEELRPGRTVTICLPLFLAGGEQERAFAQTHPTIAVDGCARLCAQRGTEAYSGPVDAVVTVTEVLGEGYRLSGQRSTRRLTSEDWEAVDRVAQKIAEEVDSILDRVKRPSLSYLQVAKTGCICSRSVPTGHIMLDGQKKNVIGLPLIFQQMVLQGVKPEPASGQWLLEAVKIYNQVQPTQEAAFRSALVQAYSEYCQNRS